MEQSLLNWGITNSVGPTGDASELHALAADVAAGKREDLKDPKLWDALMGKSDGVLMKEALEGALDETKEEDERLEHLDNMELLVEQFDNAANLENLKMWDPITSFFAGPSSTSTSPALKEAALWVAGTAINNNPKAQADFLTKNPIPSILPYLTSTSTGLRSRALYCLSGALKHAPVSTTTLLPSLSPLLSLLSDPDIQVRRKVVFLLNTLIVQTPTNDKSLIKEMENSGLIEALISSLKDESRLPYGVNGEHAELDVDFREKAIRCLISLATRGGLSEDEKSDFVSVLKSFRESGVTNEDLGVDREDSNALGF